MTEQNNNKDKSYNFTLTPVKKEKPDLSRIIGENKNNENKKDGEKK